MLTRPRVMAVAALATGVIGSYLWLNSGGTHHKAKHTAVAAVAPQSALREALAYVPSSSPYAAVVQTSPRLSAISSALALAGRFPGADQVLTALEGLLHKRTGLDVTTDLASMLGNPIVIAGDSLKNVTIAWAATSSNALDAVVQNGTDSGDLQAAGTYHDAQLYSGLGGVAIAVSGSVFVAGPNPATVRAAVDRAAGAGGMTPSQFETRAAGVPQSALVRVIASGAGLRRLIDLLYPAANAVPFVSALSGGALALSAASDGVHGVLRINTSPGVLTPADLPLAAGAAAPVLHGSGSITVGVRNIAHLGHFVLDAGEATNAALVKSYDQIDGLLTRFAHIDLDQQILSTLTGSATITTDDLHNFSLSAETTDPDGVSDVLSRVGAIGSVGGFLGVNLDGYSVSSDDNGLVTISHDDNPLVTAGVIDGTFVASTDPKADFDALASAPERDDGTPPARGSLRGLVSAKVFLDLLVDDLGLPESTRTLLQPLGAMLVTARATSDAITAQLFIPVADN